jgi:PAS domain S-box-containing protein
MMRSMSSPGRESGSFDAQVLRRLVDTNILGIFSGNFEGAIIEANDAFLRMVQYSREDVVSGRLRWTDLTPPEWRERDERTVAEVKATGMIQPYEKEYFRKDGSRVPVMIGSALFEGGNEGVVFVLDLSEQKRAQEARRSSEAYLAEAQRMSHTGSWAWNAATGEPSYWSEECYRVLGYNPAQPLPPLETFFQRILPEERAAVQEQFDRAIRDKADFELDLRFVHPITGIRTIHSVSHAVLDQRGESREIVGTVIDITDRKRAEDEQRHAEAVIREQEAELRQVVDTIPAIVWSTLPDGSNTYVNKRFVEYSGSSGEQMAGSGWKALIHPDDLERHADKWMEAVATGKPLENEVRSRRSDGQYRWQLDRGVPLRDKDGNIVKWYGVTTDIEDRKRAEEALGILSRDLQENTAKLEEAQRVAHVGYWEWDLRTDHVTWSDETYRIYGLHPQKCPIELATIRESIHPEDREFVFRKAAEAIQGEVRVDAEHRIVRPNGEVRAVHSQGDLKRDAAGLPWQMFGTVQDITDRKLAEDKIREQEAGLRQMLDLAPQHIGVYGPNRERLYLNHVSLDYFGISLEEWQQSPGRGDYVHPEDSGQLDSVFGRVVARGSADEFELRLRRRDGTYRWFLARFNPLRDEQGQIMRWYVAATDIEDRKQAEDRLRSENVALREEIDKASMFEEIVGTSPVLKAVLSRISKVAPSGSTVLITGETGTGKELVARAIHRISDRASRAFVSVNCAAIPRDLIASELFGHEKGAFTGATQQRLGRFELANGGTLFLDEVGELPAETQIALLRVLQEHEFERVGGTRRIRADVRVIAATNRDLQAAIKAGSFRSDLFYRLNVFPIEIPSLRERREDIPMLVEYFIDRYARKASKQIKRINKKTLELLQSYAWPGNIRELQNVIERSMILCETEIFSIDENWLPPPLTLESKQQVGLRRRFLLQEKDMIETALKDTGGRVSGPTGAAVKLGMPRSTMESKIRSLRINKNRFRS